MMPAHNDLLTIILLSIEGIFYIPVIFLALARRAGQETSALLLAIYAGIGLLVQAAELLVVLGVVPLPFFRILDLASTLVLALLLLASARAFLRQAGGRGWLIAGGAWLALIVLLYARVIPLPDIIWQGQTTAITAAGLPMLLLALGWLVFMLVTVITLRRAYQHTRQPLHRNRIFYWLPVLILLVANDLLVLLALNGFGSFLRVAGVLLLTYVVLTYHLPDVRDLFRRALIYLITSALVLGVYWLGYIATRLNLQATSGINPILVGGIIAVILAAGFAPALSFIRRSVTGLFKTEYYDPAETLREYSLRISNILEVERLADVAVGMIIDAMEISRGFLYLVDRLPNAQNEMVYSLRSVHAGNHPQTADGMLQETSPIARFLVTERRPLLQYDLDFLPLYQKADPAEQAWFKSLDCEVYVPIFSKGQWIGLFALGQKLSGTRYRDEDLTALSTLANQTAVALENARLVENLVQLNERLKAAYSELEQAKRNLEQLDRTKTDFISIASHELRTPLTVMRGYAGMLLDMPAITQESFLLKTVQGINESALRMHDIMESMFAIVQLDTRAMQIHTQDVPLSGLIREVVRSLRKDAEARGQTLKADLPSLPPVSGDPDLLTKLLQNLVRNAIKFTPDGGKITITGATRLPDADFPTGSVEIVVSDTGVGVAPQMRDIIFTKFYQPGDLNKHSTGKSKFKGSGTGLGLALSKGIVEAHGGRIWVESPGHDEKKCPGSQFHVVLPIKK
ncbi:MAG: GAF domain-containing sensor histidine kinase [Anaerolineales bacterium]